MKIVELPHQDKRIVVIDESTEPAQMLTNCLTCNRMTAVLDSEGIMCLDCYKKWSIHFAKTFVLPF